MNITFCVVCKKASEHRRYVQLATVNLKESGETPICICEECAHDVIETFEHWDN